MSCTCVHFEGKDLAAHASLHACMRLPPKDVTRRKRMAGCVQGGKRGWLHSATLFQEVQRRVRMHACTTAAAATRGVYTCVYMAHAGAPRASAAPRSLRSASAPGSAPLQAHHQPIIQSHAGSSRPLFIMFSRPSRCGACFQAHRRRRGLPPPPPPSSWHARTHACYVCAIGSSHCTVATRLAAGPLPAHALTFACGRRRVAHDALHLQMAQGRFIHGPTSGC